MIFSGAPFPSLSSLRPLIVLFLAETALKIERRDGVTETETDGRTDGRTDGGREGGRRIGFFLLVLCLFWLAAGWMPELIQVVPKLFQNIFYI